MRRFKFIGGGEHYAWDEQPILGQVYPENHFGTKDGVPYIAMNRDLGEGSDGWGQNKDAWEEVFEDVLPELTTIYTVVSYYDNGVETASTNVRSFKDKQRAYLYKLAIGGDSEIVENKLI